MIDDVTTQLRRGVVEFCVLGFLSARPMYGWELSSALIERGLIASIGTLYPLLGRLRDRGLIVTFEQQDNGEPDPTPDAGVATPSGGPTRKYYRLTQEGESHLAAFRTQWGPFTQNVTEILEKGLES
ncbi:PadR family transcriptional regulator [Leucobacter aridicollis]|uniref:PadR family transcriptional regulator n=1 Tax=Leucobacter aridicollis TaxID=283878 RepID=UPI000E65132D|nr:PadR family transcriptional regulator [Leucobacter aridicollis]UTX54150.1 PadR family transcriptional regulator [Leucobacter aridicollis]